MGCHYESRTQKKVFCFKNLKLRPNVHKSFQELRIDLGTEENHSYKKKKKKKIRTSKELEKAVSTKNNLGFS